MMRAQNMSTERAFAPAPRRHTALRLLPGIQRSARAPFVVLILMIMGIGLVGLLLLNTSIQQTSFELDELRRGTTKLRDQHAVLAEEVAKRSAPDSLARAAQQLGMVPAEEPAFIEVDVDGSP